MCRCPAVPRSGARCRPLPTPPPGANCPEEAEVRAMRYPLPYAFARTQQLLLEETDDGALTLWMPQTPPKSALSEVVRKYPVKAFEPLTPGELAQRISAAYAKGESNAAAVVSEVQSDADLSRMMQELPAVEDLLESAG